MSVRNVKKRPLFKKASTDDSSSEEYGCRIKRKAKTQWTKLSDHNLSNNELVDEPIQSLPVEEAEPTITSVASGNQLEDETDLDDLMAGVCPEDLNNTTLHFNNSMMCVTTPVKQSDHPAGTSTPNTNIKSAAKRCLLPSPVRCATSELNHISVSAVDKVNQVLGPDFKGFQSSSTTLVNLKCKDLTVYPTETFYGLPLEVSKCFDEFRGIKKLYDWQEYCLRLSCLAHGKNLIYSLPTSGGKTLVAEVLIFQQLLLKKKDVIFILPFVAIVQEKVQELTLFAAKLDFIVEEYAASKGRLPPQQRRKRNVVFIATIEKASTLVNSLIEVDRIKSVGLVVADELHMLGEGGMRGATLELCLSKLLYCNGDVTQIIGMSATLSNINDLASFLNAEIYCNDFRPVELHEYVKVGRTLYTIDNSSSMDRVQLKSNRTIQHKPNMDKLDVDQLATLVLEVIPDSSCLIFCPTKKNCQNMALLLTKLLPRTLLDHCKDAKLLLLETLKVETSGLCSVLRETIPFGVAYHNSGLTSDERKLIEAAYHDGTLCVITCTSTLAAGVNLPAKRVILRAPYIGNQLMTFSQYKQMTGRAGRAGFGDKSGDSILILPLKDGEKVLETLKGPYSRCDSNLLLNDYQAMHSLVLTLVGLKLVTTSNELKRFISKTLCCIQQGSSCLFDQTSQVLDHLHKLELITGKKRSHDDTVTYDITPLGRATYKGSVIVDTAHVVYGELVTAQQCLVVTTDLHLLYLCIPLELVNSIDPNWRVFFDKFTKLENDELKVAQILDISEGYLSKKFSGVASKLPEDKEIAYRKFYLAIVIHCLLKQPSRGVWIAAEQFECSRGFLQNALHSTASFASSLVHFTEEISELWAIHLLLPNLVKKLAYLGSPEMVALLEIPGVKQGRARQLANAGYKTIQEIASADYQELSKCAINLFPAQAKNIILAAQALLRDKAEALKEEAEDLLSLFP